MNVYLNKFLNVNIADFIICLRGKKHQLSPFASLIVFYYIRFIMRELIYTPVYTEKKSLYSYLSCHTRKVFFRDFAINRPINLFCEIFGHLITALKFLNFHIADHPSTYLRSSTTLKYISNMFAC